MQLCAAAAAGFETVVVVAVTGDSGADAGAVGAAGERTAPVAVETGSESTQQDAACGRVGPGCRTQGATALAAPSHLMRERRRNETKSATLEQKDMNAHIHISNFFLFDSYTTTLHKHTEIQHCVIYISHYKPPTYPFQNRKTIMNHLKFIVFTVYSNDIDKSL